MAKIVTYDKQIEALNCVTEQLKILVKLKPLIIAQDEIQTFKISICAISDHSTVNKASYVLNHADGMDMVILRYKQISNRVRQLTEEFHIALSDEEVSLISCL